MFAEALSVFFDVAGGFAIDALRTPAGGVAEAEPEAVIFDANGLNLDELDVVTQEPAFVVPTSTWPGLGPDDSFVIASATYRARQVYLHRDGALTVAELVRV